VRYFTLLFVLSLAACATPEQRAAQAAKDYGPACEKRGLAQGSEKWRACVETEALNASLATQRDYEQEMLRKRDCVNPLMGCGPAGKY
jgi:hypothetical protein